MRKAPTPMMRAFAAWINTEREGHVPAAGGKVLMCLDCVAQQIAAAVEVEHNSCLLACDGERERILNTEHGDGVGMGNQQKAAGCEACIDAIRRGATGET